MCQQGGAKFNKFAQKNRHRTFGASLAGGAKFNKFAQKVRELK